MAKSIYTGISGIARNTKNIYVGVNGVARKVTKGYIGVGGVAKQFYEEATYYTWKKYNVSTIPVYYWDYYDVEVIGYATNVSSSSGTAFTNTRSGILKLIDDPPKVNAGRYSSNWNVYGGTYQGYECEVGNWYCLTRSADTPCYYISEIVEGKKSSNYNYSKIATKGSANDWTTGTFRGSKSSTNINAYPENGVSGNYWYKRDPKPGKQESCGSYISDVKSTDPNAYPTNGKHTDGYWYIKQ